MASISLSNATPEGVVTHGTLAPNAGAVELRIDRTLVTNDAQVFVHVQRLLRALHEDKSSVVIPQ